MFAVPGWSVSSDALRAETVRSGGNADAAAAPAAAPGTTSKNNQARKRKRAAASAEVTAANVADLFESVVEGKGKKDKGKKGDNKDKKAKTADSEDKKPKQQQQDEAESTAPKRQKKSNDDEPAPSKKDKKNKKQQQSQPESTPQENNSSKDKKQPQPEPTPQESKKDKKQKKKAAAEPAAEASSPAAPKPKAAKPAEPLPPAPPKLTPLQASMRQKLISARFRHLNETLYTRPSAEAYGLFSESPEMFSEYHEGFRRQVRAWPENPVDSFLADVRRRARVRRPQGRNAHGSDVKGTLHPLPRTAGTCTVADLGCGDARLAESLMGSAPAKGTKGKKDKKKKGGEGGEGEGETEADQLNVRVLSYDLQSPSPLVTRADIANLPLADGSVNVAVFCLALMGTNWIDFVEEAYRILHWKGELWVAEIKSRFAPPGKGPHAVVNHSVGNRKKAAGKAAAAAEEDMEDDLAVEVDGADDRRRETDVSAFVEVLRSRGFVLAGDPADAVDLSNRMFVKMHFIKAADPTKGKCVKKDDAGKPRVVSQLGKKGGRNGRNPLLDVEVEGMSTEREAAVLKPCVYKLR